MKIDEIYKCLPQLVGRKITKICYCEKESDYRPSGNLYIEFADGSHFEIYANAELRATGIIPYDPCMGSIVERIFALATASPLLAAKVDDTGVSVTYANSESQQPPS
jgi:hypothetical protein